MEVTIALDGTWEQHRTEALHAYWQQWKLQRQVDQDLSDVVRIEPVFDPELRNVRSLTFFIVLIDTMSDTGSRRADIEQLVIARSAWCRKVLIRILCVQPRAASFVVHTLA